MYDITREWPKDVIVLPMLSWSYGQENFNKGVIYKDFLLKNDDNGKNRNTHSTVSHYQHRV